MVTIKVLLMCIIRLRQTVFSFMKNTKASSIPFYHIDELPVEHAEGLKNVLKAIGVQLRDLENKGYKPVLEPERSTYVGSRVPPPINRATKPTTEIRNSIYNSHNSTGEVAKEEKHVGGKSSIDYEYVFIPHSN